MWVQKLLIFLSIFRTEDISYRKIYAFNHPLFKLLNLLLRRYVMSGIIQVVTRPVVQTYHQPVYSRWVLSWLVPHWHTCFNYQSLLASFHWTGLVQTFLFTINQFDIKIMERMIHYQFVHALESHNLLSDFQFSFCHKCSIVSHLLQAVRDWAGSLDCRNDTHCLFLYLAKAFCSVLYPCLLLQLEPSWSYWYLELV